MAEERNISRRRFLRDTIIYGGSLAALGLGLREISNRHRRDLRSAESQAALEDVQPAPDPENLVNIVVVFVDDLGYGDVGSEIISTPNLDQMAAEGIQLTNFYSTAPLCSPSRAGLLTGRYPIRTMVTGSLYPRTSPMNLVMDAAGFYKYGVKGIPEDEILLSEALQRRGYETALLGKWHLGDHTPHLPLENGFDYFYGALYSNNRKKYEIYRNDQVVLEDPVDQNQLTKHLTREAVAFIQDHHGQPFFLYLAHIMPHEPVHASAEFRGQSKAGLYGDAVEEVDWSMGEVLKAIKTAQLDQKTLVIFTSDNGPWWQGHPGALRGRKNLPFEGGFRVPFIARWPGVIPAGVVSDEISINFDIFSTCLSIAGIPLPEDRVIDGENILPLLRGQAGSPHEFLYYFKGKRLYGIRLGKWKYLRAHMTDNGGYAALRQGPFLFNLETDPQESYNLIDSHPEVAQALADMLDQFDAELKANIRGWKE
jgi:uncharacterized sulfatase